jgi:hypothetical protein
MLLLKGMFFATGYSVISDRVEVRIALFFHRVQV